MAKRGGSGGAETFDIHGVRLAITADAGWVRDGVGEALRPFRAPIARADAAMCLMAGGVPAAERHASCGSEPCAYCDPGTLGAERTEFRFGAMRCFRAAGKLVYSDGSSTLIVDPERARAEGTLCTEPTADGMPPRRPWR